MQYSPDPSTRATIHRSQNISGTSVFLFYSHASTRATIHRSQKYISGTSVFSNEFYRQRQWQPNSTTYRTVLNFAMVKHNSSYNP